MYFKPGRKRRQGFTLIELMMSLGVAGIVLAAITSFALYSTRSFHAFTNYADLNQKNQRTLDMMTRTIRECRSVSEISHNNITLVDANGEKISFTYFDASHPVNPESLWMSRSSGGVGKPLLEEFRPLKGRPIFEGFRRTPIKTGNSTDYEFTTTTDVNEVKLVQISWSCSRDIFLGDKQTTESVQTAKVVIRYNEANTYANIRTSVQ